MMMTPKNQTCSLFLFFVFVRFYLFQLSSEFLSIYRLQQLLRHRRTHLRIGPRRVRELDVQQLDLAAVVRGISLI